MKKIIILPVATVLALLVCADNAQGGEIKIINTNTTVSHDMNWEDTIILDGATVTIDTNATLTLKPGTTVAGKNGASIMVLGKLIATGDDEKKVRFTEEENLNKNFSLTYSIYAANNSEIELKNFILEKGGGNKGSSTSPALTIKGKADLSDGIIRRNRITAVRIWNIDTSIKNCEIYENESIALENKTTIQLKVEDNWWGSEEKPKITSLPGGNWLSGSFDFDPWQEKGPIPIVILPGFGGSFSFKLLSNRAKNDWWLPPVGMAAYRHFAKALILNNYYHDKDFFWGFYDWRKPSEESAHQYLESVISEAKEESGHSQVHILAHSMGGIVARSYIQGDEFRDDVDRLVTAGTPHLGSSEIYPIWEGGELSGGKKPLTLYLWYLQALDKNWNRVDFIRENFPSLGQMRPIYDYLVDAADNEAILYKSLNGQNEFLEKLEEEKNLLKRKVTLSLIAGTSEDTLEKIPVLPYSENDGKWRDGIPDPLDPPEDTNKGDGTVTVKSATGDGKLTEEIATIESEHGRLLESGEKTILNQLKVQAKFPLIFKTLHYFLLSARGPVETEIYDPDGKIVSESQQNIPDSRFNDFSDGENSLVFSDFPIDIEGQDKKVLRAVFTGKERGTFKSAFWHLTENDEMSNIEEEHPIEAGVKVIYEISLENISSGKPKISVENITWSNLLNITHPESNGKYLNWQYLTPEANIRQIGENINNLQLAYKINDEPVSEKIDLGLLALGKHNLKANGRWEINGGEQAEEKESTFIISTSHKSLITLINRFYSEQKITSWETRSALINLLAEAYQESSNGRTTNAHDKIVEARNVLKLENESIVESETRERLDESLRQLEENQHIRFKI
ncbi:MAG: alpha/beta hydrolase [Candidatus Moraniibacteriota bacterium]